MLKCYHPVVLLIPITALIYTVVSVMVPEVHVELTIKDKPPEVTLSFIRLPLQTPLVPLVNYINSNL